jgi:hyperosmotically inducible periplasmic protein
MMRVLPLAGMFFVALTLSSCETQTGRVEKNPRATDADNTARNERDRNPGTQLPTDQAENQADREISANVRKAVMADNSLSTNAQNIKIVTSNGTVTLRGPVKTAQEKEAIEAKAKQVLGVNSVVNLLEIEGKS